ncbi:hypothetical protein [uncultured Winogradskyella sp.]|uniref:hypothetical protein n=1 Tax=Winogradskyella sp. 4-2091 TaxID=3381659 RepID=UPI002626360F|nr:hypothetical protein [uncultured Winogradskyella sp.]
MSFLIALIQNTKIDEKLKQAPDDNYSIGVFIGTLLPFVVLVIIAFVIYRYNKNRYKDN